MGRRAKNKQGNPAPLAESQEKLGRPSAKKLGKRKADTEGDSTNKRPTKRSRESDPRPPKRVQHAKGGRESASGPTPSIKAKRKPTIAEEADSDSGDGWEDVQDAEDVKTQAK